MRGPRKYLRYPEEFGVTDPAEPARLPPSQQFKAVAAQAQHELARQVHEQMARLGLDYATLAPQVDLSEEQLKRLLRGESGMSVERMHQLAKAAALRLTIQIKRSE